MRLEVPSRDPSASCPPDGRAMTAHMEELNMIGIFAKGIAAAALASGAPSMARKAPTIDLLQDPPVQGGAQGTPTGGGPQNPSYFNPQLSLVTDFRINLMDNTPGADKRAFLKEAELALAADVDPHLRAEAYIAIVDEGGTTEVEIEEAFGRYSHLGGGLSAKFGKIAAAVGRVSRNHVDQLNFLDFP